MFDRKPFWAPTITLNGKCKDMGKHPPPYPKGITKHCAIENASGLVATIRTSEDVSRLIAKSQLAPSPIRAARTPKIRRRVMRKEYRFSPLRAEIKMMGVLSEWLGDTVRDPDDLVDGRWRVYSRGFANQLLSEMMGTEEQPNDSHTKNPYATIDRKIDDSNASTMWDSDILRTDGGLGPQKVLGGTVGDALCYLELEALLDGLPSGAKERYLGGWGRWRMFCDARNFAHRVDASEAHWGERLLDFTTYGSQVPRLSPSTTRGRLSAVRYAYIVSGKADPSPCGLRYILMLSGMDRSRMVKGLLPPNTDLAVWVWPHFVSGDTSLAPRELRCALNLCFFMHFTWLGTWGFTDEWFEIHLSGRYSYYRYTCVTQ